VAAGLALADSPTHWEEGAHFEAAALAVSVSSSRLVSCPRHFADQRTQTNRDRERARTSEATRDEMPGLTAPSDYAEEPPRHPALRINSKVSAAPPLPPRPCFLPTLEIRVVGRLVVSPSARIRSPAGRTPPRVSTVPVHNQSAAVDAVCRSAERPTRALPRTVCGMRARLLVCVAAIGEVWRAGSFAACVSVQIDPRSV